MPILYDLVHNNPVLRFLQLFTRPIENERDAYYRIRRIRGFLAIIFAISALSNFVEIVFPSPASANPIMTPERVWLAFTLASCISVYQWANYRRLVRDDVYRARDYHEIYVPLFVPAFLIGVAHVLAVIAICIAGVVRRSPEFILASMLVTPFACIWLYIAEKTYRVHQSALAALANFSVTAK